MKDLLVLTTAGRSHWVKDAIATLDDPLDILVVDDASPEPVGSDICIFCKEKNVRFHTFEKPKGLTRSWNWAYQFFLKNGYDRCIISNDDVRFSNGFSKALLDGTSKYTLVCPVSNRPTGKPTQFPRQWLFRYCAIQATHKRKNRDEIQRTLEEKYVPRSYRKMRTFNGYCFAFSRSGIEEFVYDNGYLFDPGNINTKNDIEMGRRIRNRGGVMAVCLASYVFHWKCATAMETRAQGKADKNVLASEWPTLERMKLSKYMR